MPSLAFSRSVAAGATDLPLAALGWTFETLPFNAAVRVLLRTTATGVLARIRSGSEEVQDEKRSKEETSALKDRQDVASPNKSDSVDSVPSVASAPRVMIPATGSEASDFRASVLSAIEEVAFFPKKALQQGRHGQVVVQFTIHREGSITDLTLVKHSGSEELDLAALRIIQRASEKFPHFPEQFSRESVSYEVPIVFKAKSSESN